MTIWSIVKNPFGGLFCTLHTPSVPAVYRKQNTKGFFVSGTQRTTARNTVIVDCPHELDGYRLKAHRVELQMDAPRYFRLQVLNERHQVKAVHVLDR